MKWPSRMCWLFGLSAVLVLLAACDPSQEPGDADSPPAPSVSATRLPTAQVPGLPPEFTNLQVLPADISKEELKQRMKLIARSLGKKCDYCHRTDVRDFASDEIREKVMAREMMRMVDRINQEHFTWEDAPEATCFMCHQGRRKPRMDPDSVNLPDLAP